MASLVNIFEDDNEEPEDLIITLKKYVKKMISSRELLDSDYFIDDVKVRHPLGETIIIFDINDDDFLKTLDVSDNDIWFYNMINSYYSGYEFEDFGSTRDHFLETGYIFSNFNTENIELLKKISNLLLPTEEFNINNTEFSENLANNLYRIFEGETERIVYSFWEENESAYLESARKGIDDDFTDILNKMGFSLYNGNVSTTVGDLVLHIRYFDYHGDLEGLYNTILNKYKDKINPDWGENYYDYYDSRYFDDAMFNRNVKSNLEKILDEINEDGSNLKEYLNLVNKISSKFVLKKFNRLPKNNNYSFRILDIDRDTLKITLEINGPNGFFKRKVNEEGFYNFLYTGELFDLEV